MHITGDVVHYLLKRKFNKVTCDRSARRIRLDYPILYDVTADMSGHAVLIPEHERPHAQLMLAGSVCVCMSSEAASSAREAGFPVIEIGDDVTFPRLYNYMQETFVSFERLDAQVRAYIDTGAGANQVLDAFSEMTGCSFALVDEQFRELYRSHPGQWQDGSRTAPIEDPRMLEEEAIDLFMGSRSYRHMRSSHNVFAVPGSPDLLAVNVFRSHELKGMVMCRHSGDPLHARYVQFIVGVVGEFIEALFARLGSFGMAPTGSDRIRAALSHLLSGGSMNRVDIQALLRENGHPPQSRYVVLRIQRSFTYEGPEDAEYLTRRFELAWPRAYCFTADNALFMFADVGDNSDTAGRDFMGEILLVARDNLSKVGASRPFATLKRIDAARTQATIALEQGSVIDPTYWFYRFDDYALSWLAENGRGGLPADYVAHPAVSDLARYDKSHGTELLATLTTFIRERYNATRAADALYVARSTLLNRLERMKEITSLDLENPDELAYLNLSLVLSRSSAEGDAGRRP